MREQRACLGCKGTGGGWMVNTFPCLVCGGSGTVDAKASVRDAVADAETLRGTLATEPFQALEFRHARALYTLRFTPYDPFKEMRETVRAAFRAVPGLRGE